MTVSKYPVEVADFNGDLKATQAVYSGWWCRGVDDFRLKRKACFCFFFLANIQASARADSLPLPPNATKNKVAIVNL